jgi:ABC-type bacteriocin/lantibiotic exporter with double-glycine peptidase domain
MKNDGFYVNNKITKFLLAVLLCSSFACAEQYLLNINHIRQAPMLCVPTSVAMVLDFYGEKVDPKELKRKIEDTELKDNDPRLYKGTKFWKTERALKEMGYNWETKDFDINNGNAGIALIKSEIRQGRPVLVAIDVKYGQHVVVVKGFTEEDILVSDPDELDSTTNYSCMEFRKIWRNDSESRSLMKTEAKKKTKASR